VKRRQQNQKFPSFQIFRLAAGGVGGAANKNERKFLGFAPRELVERGRGAKVSRFVQNAFEQSYIIPPVFGISARDLTSIPCMLQSATITSKLQLTIPASIARTVGIAIGDKVVVSEEEGRIVLTPTRQLIEKLAGSISIPPKFKGKQIDEIIREAKLEHFKNKTS
jgi:AbrB family looped-hinge helix DNA binding protein